MISHEDGDSITDPKGSLDWHIGVQSRDIRRRFCPLFYTTQDILLAGDRLQEKQATQPDGTTSGPELFSPWLLLPALSILMNPSDSSILEEKGFV